MSVPTSIICRHKKTWFDSLSVDRLRDLCRAAGIDHFEKRKPEIIISLCQNEISSPFASATVASIKDMCRSRSLPSTGLKYQLALRVCAHDSLKDTTHTTDNVRKVSVELMSQELEDVINYGLDAYRWLAETMEDIRDLAMNHVLRLSSTNRFQTPLAAFRDAESAFSVLRGSYIPNAGTDKDDSLSKAINHLGYLVVEARVFLSNSEKKAAVSWIQELDNFLSEYMLGENSKTPLKDLVQLLNDDAYHLPKSHKRNGGEPVGVEPERVPLRCLMNDSKPRSNKAVGTAKVVSKKPKPKVITNKKEIVYKKMANVLRKPGVDSDHVYGRLLRLMKSILRQFDDYESLGLFRAVFMALIVHFEKIDHPYIDTDHSFTIAIDMLGNLLEDVMGALSTKEKEEVIRWMTDLHALTRPHALGEIAETPLDELISMVKKSKADEHEIKPRRFFFP